MFKLNDKVYCSNSESFGYVQEIKAYNYMHPLVVNFGTYTRCYTFDGRINTKSDITLTKKE